MLNTFSDRSSFVVAVRSLHVESWSKVGYVNLGVRHILQCSSRFTRTSRRNTVNVAIIANQMCQDCQKPHTSVFSASQRFNILGFAFSAACSLTSTATAQQLQSGGHTGAFRGTQRHQPDFPPANCVDSAALAQFPACHFSGWFAQFAFSAFLCDSVVNPVLAWV